VGLCRKQALSRFRLFGCHTEPEMSAQIELIMPGWNRGLKDKRFPQFYLRSGSLHSEKIGWPLAGAAGRVSRP
jgi:hypothetical protein